MALPLATRLLGLDLPLPVRFQDPSGPFAVDATITAWQKQGWWAGDAGAFRCRLGTGTLFDTDKGPFPIAGVELTVRVSGERLEPGAVLNPGVLTEFQQAGLLDAVCSALNDLPTWTAGDTP